MSNPDYEQHLETTGKVLEELGAQHKRTILAFNKIDAVEDSTIITALKAKYPDAVFISAAEKLGLDVLQDRMLDMIASGFEELDLIIPHARYDLVSQLYREGGIIDERMEDDGYHIQARLSDRIREQYMESIDLPGRGGGAGKSGEGAVVFVRHQSYRALRLYE